MSCIAFTAHLNPAFVVCSSVSVSSLKRTGYVCSYFMLMSRCPDWPPHRRVGPSRPTGTARNLDVVSEWEWLFNLGFSDAHCQPWVMPPGLQLNMTWRITWFSNKETGRRGRESDFTFFCCRYENKQNAYTWKGKGSSFVWHFKNEFKIRLYVSFN